MRCAILVLVSRGKPTETPSEARDSEDPLPHASKTSRQKVAPRAATWDAVSWKARLRVSTSWKTSATDGEEMWEVPSKDETEKSKPSANPDTPLGIQMSAGRRPPLAGEEGSITGSSSKPAPPGSAGGGRARASLTEAKSR